MSGDIPLLDLSACGLLVEDESQISEETFASFGKELYGVLSTSGFAYLANHGVPRDRIEAASEISEKFFALPEEEKKKLHTRRLDFAYDPIYTSKADFKHGDYYEAFRVAGPAFSSNETQWPNIPDFRTISWDLAETLKILVHRLLRALGSGMQLKDKEYFCKAHSLVNKEGNATVLKYSHYPPVVTNDVLTDKTTRIGEHADATSLTLVLQDSNGGLQAETEVGIFKDVPPIPGTIVLNIGDVLQKWSGGRLRSTVHRVVPPKDPEKRKNSRRSILYFPIGNDDALMEPLQFEDGTVDGRKIDENPETVAQFLKERFKKLFV